MSQDNFFVDQAKLATQSNAESIEPNMEEAFDEIRSVIRSNNLVLFIKGTPENPMCGFTVKILNIIRILDLEYAYVDVISKPNIRSAIKKFTDWPTVPQIFINSEFIGGCDIFIEMHESGQLAQMFSK